MGWEGDPESLRGEGEDGSRKTEVRSRKSEVGRWKSEGRSMEYGVGSKEFERKNKKGQFHASNEQLQAWTLEV